MKQAKKGGLRERRGQTDAQGADEARRCCSERLLNGRAHENGETGSGMLCRIVPLYRPRQSLERRFVKLCELVIQRPSQSSRAD